MNFYVLNRQEELLTILSNEDSETSILYKATVKEQINKMYTLEMEVSANSPQSQYVAEENYILFKDLLGEWQLYIIKEINEEHGTEHLKYIYCENASQELLDDISGFDIQGSPFTPEALLTGVLTGTRWEVGNVSQVVSHECVATTKKMSALAAVHAIREEYGLQVAFRYTVVGNTITNRYVDLKVSIGNDYGKRFEYDKDIIQVERIVNSTDIKTAVIPIGKDGLDISTAIWTVPTNPLAKPPNQKYLEDTTATAQWGYGVDGNKRPRYIYYEDTQIEDVPTLIQKGYEVLQSLVIPKTTYKMKVEDLFALTGDSSLSYESVRLGDYAVVVDTEFTPTLAVRTTVIERIVDLLEPANTDITLGNYIENLGDFSKDYLMGQVDKKIASISEFGNGSYKDIEKLNDQAFHEAVGYTYMEETEGLWVYDSPIDEVPSKVVAIKGGKLGIGTWNIQTQKWDISTFIDGTSVNASCINTGILKGDLIEGGSINITKLETSVKNGINLIPSKADITYVETQISTLNSEIILKASKDEVAEVAQQVTYKVDIISTNGGVFKNGQINTKLLARVYRGATDVTDTLDASRFKWERVSTDTDGDIAWNTAHFGGTKEVNITSADVTVRATFTCEILDT